MQADFLHWTMAMLPVILLILLLTVFKRTTAGAALITLTAVVLTSLAFFGAGPGLMGLEALKGLWNAATILYVIFPALLLYELIAEAGCIEAINVGMQKISPNELFRILAVGWVFAGFLQGITGFGVPVAICVPILMSLGVKPARAVVISLLGQSWGNTFGTLAVAWDMLADIAGLEGVAFKETALITAFFLWMLDLIVGLVICWLCGGFRGIRTGLAFVLVISLIQGGGEALFSQINTTIAAFVPSTAALVAVPLLSRLKIYRQGAPAAGAVSVADFAEADAAAGASEAPAPAGVAASAAAGAEAGANVRLSVAFSPYITLIIVTVLLLVVEPVNEFLGQWSVGLSFPQTQTENGFVNEGVAAYSPFYPLVDSGTVLLLTYIISYFILRGKGLLGRGSAARILKNAALKTRPSASSICLLLMISKLMSGTGQTLIIADGITAALGEQYALMAGFIGLIGSFITGSNMSSNILFTDVQSSAAASLGGGSEALLAAQTAGGAVGSMISPSKIVLGATAAGQAGREGSILRALLPVAAAVTVVIGVICRLII